MLQLVLEQAGEGSEKPIGYFVDAAPGEGADKAAVLVSTMEELKKQTDTRVYEIADLMEWGAEPESAHLLIGVAGKPTIESMQYASREPGGKASAVPAIDARAELLLGLLPDTIGNQSDWAANGGEVCYLRELNGHLIIKAPRPWHRQIEQLLADLREARVLSLASLMRHREVLTLLKQAEVHRFQQRYDEAMVVVNQALRVDPDHPYALGLKEVIQKTRERRAASR